MSDFSAAERYLYQILFIILNDTTVASRKKKFTRFNQKELVKITQTQFYPTLHIKPFYTANKAYLYFELGLNVQMTEKNKILIYENAPHDDAWAL